VSKLTSGATRDRATVRVCFDRALVSELERVEDALRDAEKERNGMLGDDKLVRLKERANDLRKQVNKKSTTLVFESMGRTKWESFMADHPPTDEQIKEAEASKQTRPRFNPETFPAAAMLRTCVEPEGFDAEDARFIAEELPVWKYVRVFDTVLNANEYGAADPFDIESATRNGSGGKSRLRSVSESRTASS
jgi:hypothetical protein